MSTSWLHSTTTSSTAFSIIFYSMIVARVPPTHGLTRNVAMQSVLHAGWNVRTPLYATGQLVAPQHQVTRTRQRVLLLRKPVGTINALNTASCIVKSVRISGMTWLTPIGAILADYGTQSMFYVLLGCGRMPANSAISTESFNRFFTENVAKVRWNTAEAPPPTFSLPCSAASFTTFTLLTVDNIVNAVWQLPDKFSAADPLPTSTLKQDVDLLALFIVEVFNHSLARSHFPTGFKKAFIMFEFVRRRSSISCIIATTEPHGRRTTLVVDVSE